MKRHIVTIITLLALGVTAPIANSDTTNTTASATTGTTASSFDPLSSVMDLSSRIPQNQQLQQSYTNVKTIYQRIKNNASALTTTTAKNTPAPQTTDTTNNTAGANTLDPLDIILTLANKVQQNKELTTTMKANLLGIKSVYQHTAGAATGVVNGAICSLSQIAPLSTQNNLNPDVYNLAMTAYMCAIKSGMDQQRILTIVDYTLPSTQKRLWVFDLANKRTLFNTYVAHGKGSGAVTSQVFSDQPDTHASSIGLFLTGNIYQGHDGYSMKLYGLEKGFNDKAFEREIVMHGAPYVSEERAKAGGLGRSWGCLALPLDQVRKIVDTVKQGSLIFSFYPNQQWLQQSKFLHCIGNVNQQPTVKSF